MVLTITLTINYKITTLVRFLKDVEEKPSEYYTSLVVMLLMVVLITIYLTLY